MLDADVIIDLHSLGLFDKLRKAYDIYVTREVLREAQYYPKGRKNLPIRIKQEVTVIEDIEIDCLRTVQKESREARLTIDPGEAESIAYLLQCEEDISFCSCDKAAFIIMSFMNLEQKALSLEKAFREAGYNVTLLPRHLQSEFKRRIKDGKTLRIQFKKLI